MPTPIGLARLGILVAGLTAASVYDVRERSVPAYLLLGLLIIEAAMLALDIYANGVPRFWAIYAAADVLTLIAFAGLTLVCLIGLGDLVAYAAVVAAWPWGWSLLPLPLTTLLYYALASLTLMAYNIAANLLDPEARRALKREPLARRLYLLLTARLVPVEKILGGSWWIPLIEGGERRVVCSTEVDPSDVVREAIEKGMLRKEDRVWATWGIPALPLMLIGLLAALAIGDKPILYLLRVLA